MQLAATTGCKAGGHGEVPEAFALALRAGMHALPEALTMASPAMVELSACGSIDEGSPSSTISGRPIARVADAVTHDHSSVACGAPHVSVDGKELARHGDPTSCGGRVIEHDSTVLVVSRANAEQRSAHRVKETVADYGRNVAEIGSALARGVGLGLQRVGQSTRYYLVEGPVALLETAVVKPGQALVNTLLGNVGGVYHSFADRDVPNEPYARSAYAEAWSAEYQRKHAYRGSALGEALSANVGEKLEGLCDASKMCVAVPGNPTGVSRSAARHGARTAGRSTHALPKEPPVAHDPPKVVKDGGRLVPHPADGVLVPESELKAPSSPRREPRIDLRPEAPNTIHVEPKTAVMGPLAKTVAEYKHLVRLHRDRLRRLVDPGIDALVAVDPKYAPLGTPKNRAIAKRLMRTQHDAVKFDPEVAAFQQKNFGKKHSSHQGTLNTPEGRRIDALTKQDDRHERQYLAVQGVPATEIPLFQDLANLLDKTDRGMAGSREMERPLSRASTYFGDPQGKAHNPLLARAAEGLEARYPEVIPNYLQEREAMKRYRVRELREARGACRGCVPVSGSSERVPDAWRPEPGSKHPRLEMPRPAFGDEGPTAGRYADTSLPRPGGEPCLGCGPGEAVRAGDLEVSARAAGFSPSGSRAPSFTGGSPPTHGD